MIIRSFWGIWVRLDIQRSSMFDVTWFETKIFNGSNFHLRIADETKQNWTISEKINNGRWNWITYDNNVRKRSWSKQDEALQMIARSELTPKKVMLCLMGLEKIVHYELLPPGKTIDSDLYCQQLRLKRLIQEKWSELINKRNIVFHHDNAKP